MSDDTPSDQQELMLKEVEGDVEEAYLFLKQALANDTRRCPDFLLESRSADIDGNIRKVQIAIDSQFDLIAEKFIEDQALGKVKPGQRFTPENRAILSKAGVLFLLLERSKRMLGFTRYSNSVTMLSLINRWSEKLLSFCIGCNEQSLENVYAFYYFDAYPLYRALSESCGLNYEKEIKEALADPDIKAGLNKKLSAAMERYYK